MIMRFIVLYISMSVCLCDFVLELEISMLVFDIHNLNDFLHFVLECGRTFLELIDASE